MATSLPGIGSPRLAGVILTGGASSRMGTDKATLKVDNRPLLARVAAAMAESVDGPIVVVGRAAQSCRLLAAAPALHDPRRFWDYMCIDDAPGCEGPADGLCLGVEVLTHRFPSIERVVVSPCDLPRVSASGFSYLLDSDSRSTIDVEQSLFDEFTPKATVVRIDGRPQWLSAVLHKPLLSRLGAPARRGTGRVSDLFADAAITWFDDVDREFVDADTPIDLREAIAPDLDGAEHDDEQSALADAS